MKLSRISERIWILPFEEERDRPNLGYIRGDRWSIAVDAGHSADHTETFYRALEKEGLPLPSLTVLTHWHWDHTFGMNAVHGLSLANEQTNRYLLKIRDEITQTGREHFLSLDEKIRKEYAGDRPVIVTMADMVFTGEVLPDAGNCHVRIFRSEAPHTDDSTLIYVPGEKVLFLGDAAYGAFPTWESDPVLSGKLAESILPLNAEICVASHHPAYGKNEVIRYLMAGSHL